MRAVAVALLMAFLPVPANANGFGWEFSIRETFSGQLCFASVERNNLRIGFFAAPHGAIFAFVQGPDLPNNARSTWQVDGYQWRQLVGGVDEDNGLHIYTGVRADFLREVAAGASLDLYLHDAALAGNSREIDTRDISLRASARSISALMNCQADYSAPDRFTPAATGAPGYPASHSQSLRPQPMPAPQEHTDVVPQYAANPPARIRVHDEEALDRLTTYTSVLGRGIACGLDTQIPQQKVYAWMEWQFADNLEATANIYIMGLAISTEQQIAGTTGDTCSSLRSTIATFPWPA